MKNILVSACLLGVNCRYNGIEKRNDAVLGLLENSEERGLHFIPICPEQLGGLPTPRYPSECQGDRVMNDHGQDVTEQYCRGAKEALRIAKIYRCDCAILKERSPSCGHGEIYDGTFSKRLVQNDGITAKLFREHDIKVYGESELRIFREDSGR